MRRSDTRTLIQAKQKEEMDKQFTQKIEYEALKGNEIDQIIAQKIDDLDVRVPIIRLETVIEEGGSQRNKYLFGTKIILVRVHKRELMVRVGGGYVKIAEFVIKYSNGEIARLKVAMSTTGKTLAEIVAKLSTQTCFK